MHRLDRRNPSAASSVLGHSVGCQRCITYWTSGEADFIHMGQWLHLVTMFLMVEGWREHCVGGIDGL